MSICTSFVVRTRGIVCAVYLLSRLVNYKDPCQQCMLGKSRSKTSKREVSDFNWRWSEFLKKYKHKRLCCYIQAYEFALLIIIFNRFSVLEDFSVFTIFLAVFQFLVRPSTLLLVRIFFCLSVENEINVHLIPTTRCSWTRVRIRMTLRGDQAPIVRRLHNAIQWISVNKTNHAIHCIVIYPVDRVIQPLNNPGRSCSNIKLHRWCLYCVFTVMTTESCA